MPVRTTAQRPMKEPVLLSNGKVVDAGVPEFHNSGCVKLPVLVAVRAVPLAGIGMGFVREADGDPVIAECPEFLDQAIVQLRVPFPGEKCDDRLTALEE